MAATKITLKTKTLLDAVSKVSMWTTRNSPIQALQCIRFTLSGGAFELTAMDGSSTDITLFVDAGEPDGEFDVCIPVDRILPKLQLLAKSSDEVSLSFGKSVMVTTKRHKSRISPISAELFPTVNRDFVLDGGTEVSVQEFVNAIKMTMASADPNSPYPALEGIYMNGEDMVSADGTRIAIYTKDEFVDGDILVPATSLARVAKAIEGIDTVFVLRGDERMIVYWDEGIIVSTLISYSFPDYKSLIPESYETTFSLSRSELLEAIGLANVDAVESKNLLVIKASDDTVVIMAESDAGGHISELDPTNFDGPPKDFGLSIKYLKDAIMKLKSSNITFGVNSATKLVVLYDDDSYKYGIMPMHWKE